VGLGIGGFLEQLIGPPGGFIFLILIGLLLIYRQRRRMGLYLAGAGLLLLYLTSLPLVANAMASWLEPDTALTETVLSMTGKQPQAIVILGAGRRTRTPEYSGDTLNAFALERARYGVWLARRTLLPVLVSGGLAKQDSQPEALLMKQVIEGEYALPVRWLEVQSRNTFENARYSAEILKKAGIDTIYLVTHALHMKRSRQAFEEFGLHVIPAPTVFEGGEMRDVSLRDFLPSAKALYINAHVFHEWVGIVWYRLRYVAL